MTTAKQQAATRVGLVGGRGRMGRAIAALIEAEGTGVPGVSLAGAVDDGDDVAPLAGACDVLIDFSAPAALEASCDAAIAANIALLVGTTGLEERHHFLIDDAAAHVAVLQTGNTSLGVTLLSALVRMAAERLDNGWDIEIVETHHRLKVDAPSGTALLLGEAAAAGRGAALDAVAVRGRDGITGARPDGAIGFASLRGGSVAGDHAVQFLGNQERIVLSHAAEDRTVFARGALRAARWLVGRAAGRYAMTDVLGL